MVGDKSIEELAVSSVTPQAAAATPVAAALTAGGHDNVTVVVVDVEDDGLADIHRRQRRRGVGAWLAILALGFFLVAGILIGIVRSSWYLGDNDGTVGIYRGVNDQILGFDFYELTETTSVKVDDLPESVRHQLADGISMGSKSEASATVERYRDQIDADKTRAAEAAHLAQSGSGRNQQSEGDGSAAEAVRVAEEAAERAVQEAADAEGTEQ